MFLMTLEPFQTSDEKIMAINTNYILRPAKPEDTAAITAICNHYIETDTATFEIEPITEAEMARRLDEAARKGSPCTVCEKLPSQVETAPSVVGYAYAHPWKERAAYLHTWETTVYVHSGHCHKGIGTRLVKNLIADCRSRGAHVLIACITAENGASISLHERLGFRRASLFHAVGRKFGRWLDVVDCELVL